MSEVPRGAAPSAVDDAAPDASPHPTTDATPERGLAELADEICSAAAGIAAATGRWLRLVAEFDRREGWAGQGVRSCAHWLAWRCGLSPGAA